MDKPIRTDATKGHTTATATAPSRVPEQPSSIVPTAFSVATGGVVMGAAVFGMPGAVVGGLAGALLGVAAARSRNGAS
jgi:hypothetical protein